MATKQVKQRGGNRNPTGKGGFAERPQDRSDGRWKAEDSISYQYKKFLRMSVRDFVNYEDEVPAEDRTLAQSIAYSAAFKARKDLMYAKEVTDRTEGKAPQQLDLTSSDGSMTPTVIIESVYGNKPNFRPDNQTAETNELAEPSSQQPS